ncbi:unnamed protein product [Urochloa humidicola]
MAAAEADGDAPIAAFAVSKGGIFIKHIFLNAPPSSPVNGNEEDPPVTVTVGRHPDCQPRPRRPPQRQPFPPPAPCPATPATDHRRRPPLPSRDMGVGAADPTAHAGGSGRW